MRPVLLNILLILAVLPAIAQKTLQMAPPNPDYLKFLQEYADGEDKQAAPSPYLPDYKTYWKEKTIKSPNTYPIAFDLRTAGPGGTSLLTPVKHQLSCGACWAFATYGSIESTWKMMGLGEYDLSENNLKNCSGFYTDPCQWGHHFMSTAYLARGSGPIAEADDPYQPDNDTCQSGMNPIALVPESRYLPEDHDAFKNTIMNIGPVYNTFRSVSANYEWIYGNLTFCYQGASSTSHAVAIVGWNDTLTTACGQGAWLVKDQYGSGWGDEGCYYIAYQDTLVLKYNAYWPFREPFNPDLKIYQYDTVGGWPFFGYNDSIAYGLIKYTAEGDQFLTHVGAYTVSYGTTLKAQIYSAFDGAALTGLLASLPSQYCEFPGFHRIELPERISLDNDQDFYIQIRWSSPGADFPMAGEGFDDGYTNPHVETGKCWSRAVDGNWEAWGMGTGFEYDQCIKAYGYDRVKFDLKVILEGPFNGSAMNPDLRTSSEFPLNQPYDAPPWNYMGTESVVQVPDDVVDWVLVEIRETDAGPGSATAEKIIARKACFLKSDGTIVGTDGLSLPSFHIVPITDVYALIHHRNHLPVMSSAALPKADGTYTWDFRDAADKAYGSNAQALLITGLYGLISGDGSANGLITTDDLINVWNIEAGEKGYLPSDFNLNTEVENMDKNDYWEPNEGRAAQIPQ
jgi:C1A family cysteine protease